MNGKRKRFCQGKPNLGSYDIPKIGVDASGETHYYDTENHRILVSNGDDITSIKQLSNFSQPSEWVEYIQEKRGWDSLGVIDEIADTFREEV